MEVDEQVIDAPEVEEKSLADTIRESIAEVKASKASAETPAVEAAPVEGETPQQTADRKRDDAGRFAKGEKITAQNMKAPKGEGTEPPAVAPPVPAVKAPERWPEGAKAKFATLDPEVQAAINTREAAMHKELTKQDEERLLGKKIKDTAAPYLATISAEGGTVEAAFQQFLNTAHILRGNNPELKRQALRSIAQQFSVDLGIPLQPGVAPPAPAFQPQQVSQLVQAELSSWQQRQEQAQLSSEIERFAADPANVHYEAVKPVMAALLQNGKAETLKQAYDQAIWADPDIRSSLAAAQTREAEEKRLSEARAKADAAKRAGGSVTGGPGNARALNGAGADVPLEETIRAAWRESQGRV